MDAASRGAMSAARDARRGSAVRTFLIGDIRGYTRFTAQHGDEAASRLAAAFAAIAQEAVEAWDGDLVELRGDEVLAVFDSARLALRCSIELQDALADETRARPELPLTVGIGLDAGEAVPVGDGYRGAALNTAARLCSSAAAGEVIATADLVHLAGPMPGLAFEQLEPMDLKGIDHPVVAMRVASTLGQAVAHAIGSSDVEEALPAELQPIVPLAGRDHELRWLRWHWRRAANGHGRTVVVSGAPGIGKTRLSAELATVVHAGGGRVQYLPSARGADTAELGADGLAPTLLVVDDFDAAPSPLPRAVVALAERAAETPTLLLLTHREQAAPSVIGLLEPLAGAERRRVLGPLGTEAIRSIATIYAGRRAASLPIDDLLDESGGVPAAVHRVAASWARGDATQRLGASADRTEAGRRALRDAEDELIGDVAELEQVRERSRRLALDLPQDGIAASPAAAITICPYKGLAAFEGADAEYYFGRERLVAELVARVVGSSFLGLIGASGSGKSSALRAGLLPALAAGVLPGSDAWRQVLMRPADHPVVELGRALRRCFPEIDFPVEPSPDDLETAVGTLAPGQQLVLAIDQFEEVFTATRDEAEQSAFLELLTAGRAGVKVLVTMRADHYGDVALFPALARLLSGSQVLVGPLTTLELAAVIEAPAERVGLRVEPELTRQLVEDAGTEPGVLPLLSTSLLELWQQRRAGWLTLEAYRAGGGLRGAVARLAESAFAELDPEQTRIARSIFLRLAGPGEGEAVVRRRVPLAELDADRDPAVARVLDGLVSARLLTTGDGYVEVAHEALLREWPRLQAWLEEDANGRRLRLHLMGAVRDWEQRGREPADLYRGARLSAALDWASEHQADLNTFEREFLEESRSASQRAVEHERAVNRRLRGLLAGAAVFLVVAVGAGAVALIQGDTANRQAAIARAAAADAEGARTEAEGARSEAETAASFARSRELAASSVAALAVDPSLSKLLAVAAAGAAPPDVQIETALHQAWLADGLVDRFDVPRAEPGAALTTDVSLDGTSLVISRMYWDPGSWMGLVDPATHALRWEYTTGDPGIGVGPAFFSTDGTRVFAGVYWSPEPTANEDDPQPADFPPPPKDKLGLLVFDARTGSVIDRIDLGPCGTQVYGVSETRLLLRPVPKGVDPGNACYSWFGENAVEVFDLETHALRRLSEGTNGDQAISRNGRYVGFTNVGELQSEVLDLDSGRRTVIHAFSDQEDGLIRAFSADGSLLVYGDRPAKILETGTGTTVSTIGSNLGENYGVSFGPTGDTVYLSNRDATLRVFDARTGKLLFVVPAAGTGRPAVTGGGSVLMADWTTGSMRRLEPWIHGEAGTVRTCEGFTPAGQLRNHNGIAAFSTLCDDGSSPSYVVDLAAAKVRQTVPNAFGQALAMYADGSRFVRQSGDLHLMTPPQLFDATTGAKIAEFEDFCSFNPNSADRWNEPGCKPWPDGPGSLINDALFLSPDDRFLAVLDEGSGFFGVWDTSTRKRIPAAPDPQDRFGAIFSPDSHELIMSADGQVQAYSTDTWEMTRHADLKGLEGFEFLGYLGDGKTIIGMTGYGGAGGGSLVRVDAATLEVLATARAHDGSPKVGAISPDGRLVATGASDGVVRIWDGATLTLLHQFTVPGQAQGVTFVDDHHVAVAPQAGGVLVMDVDGADVLRQVRQSLTRGFTPEECQRFGFDACPTLQELRGD